jgi:cytochrome c556
MKNVFVVLGLAATLAAGVTAAIAQQSPIDARKALMKANGRESGVVTRMVRGTDPYDAAKVTAAFAVFADTAAKYGALFPDNSKDGETRAMPAIWTDKAKFEAELAKFGKDVADGKAKATSNLDGLKEAMAAIGKDCGSCHEAFRKPQ